MVGANFIVADLVDLLTLNKSFGLYFDPKLPQHRSVGGILYNGKPVSLEQQMDEFPAKARFSVTLVGVWFLLFLLCFSPSARNLITALQTRRTNVCRPPKQHPFALVQRGAAKAGSRVCFRAPLAQVRLCLTCVDCVVVNR